MLREKNQERPFNSGEPRADLDGRLVTLSGFIVPIRDEDGQFRSVLLVPYLGACFHVPAPPANQMVMVTLDKGVGLDVVMRALLEQFTVTGVLEANPMDTPVGTVGYRLAASKIWGINTTNGVE